MTRMNDTVVLLHGLARRATAFSALATHLETSGYRVANLDYPSRSGRLNELTQALVPKIRDLIREMPPGGRLHFVCHSLGSQIARRLAATVPADRAGRLVMLGPPNQGSAIADLLLGIPLVRAAALRVLGPALHDLVTRGPGDLEFSCDVGVIAGTRSIDPLGWIVLAKPNDGRVTVAATRLPGAAHHVLPVTHALMAADRRVIAATQMFLERGAFEPDHA